MRVLERATGKWVDMPDAEVPRAFQSGTHTFANTQRVSVRLASGQLGTVEGREVDQVIRGGGRLAAGVEMVDERQKQLLTEQAQKKLPWQGVLPAPLQEGFARMREHITNPLMAGYLRGLTAGASDMATVGAQIGDTRVPGLIEMVYGRAQAKHARDLMQAYKDQHPVWSGVGEVGGVGTSAAAMAFLPGAGEAQAARGAGIGARLAAGAARVGQTAARAGVEGAIFETGMTAGEASLQDKALSAELLAPATIKGFAMGALSAGGFATAGELGGAAKRGLLNAIAPSMQKGSRMMHAQAFAPTVAWQKSIAQQFGHPEEFGSRIERLGGFRPMAPWSEEAARFQAMHDQVAQRMAEAAQSGRAVNLNKVFADMEESFAKRAGQALSGQEQRMMMQVMEDLQSRTGWTQHAATNMRAAADALGNVPKPGTAAEAARLRARLYEKMPPLEVSAPDAHRMVEESYERLFRPGHAMSPLGPNAPRHVIAQRELVGNLERAVNDAVPDPIAWKAMKKDMIAARYATDMAGERVFQGLSGPSSMARGAALGAVGGAWGGPGGMVGGAAGGAVLGAARGYAQAHGGRAIATGLSWAAKQAILAQASSAVSGGIGSGIVGFLRGTGHGMRHEVPTLFKNVKNNLERFRAKADFVKQLSADPEATRQAILAYLDDLPQHDPQLAMEMASHATRVIDYLAGAVPKDTFPDDLQPHLPSPTKVSDYDRIDFERTFDTALDPRVAVKDMHAGTLTPNQAKALRQLYPQLFRQMHVTMNNELGSLKTALPYHKKGQLATLLAMKPDITFDGTFAKYVRGTHTPITPGGSRPRRSASTVKQNVQVRTTPLQRSAAGL